MAIAKPSVLPPLDQPLPCRPYGATGWPYLLQIHPWINRPIPKYMPQGSKEIKRQLRTRGQFGHLAAKMWAYLNWASEQGNRAVVVTQQDFIALLPGLQYTWYCRNLYRRLIQKEMVIPLERYPRGIVWVMPIGTLIERLPIKQTIAEFQRTRPQRRCPNCGVLLPRERRSLTGGGAALE